MDLIRAALPGVPAGLEKIELRIDRHTLAKRRWRAFAADGRDFGFDLEKPLRHGEAFFQEGGRVWVIAQTPEPLLRVLIVTPAQAARIGWQIGNLHTPLALGEDCVLLEDTSAARQMLERERISFSQTEGVFQPLSGGGHKH